MVESVFAGIISLIMPGLGHVMQHDHIGIYFLIITFVFWIVLSITSNIWAGIIYLVYMILVAFMAYFLPEV